LTQISKKQQQWCGKLQKAVNKIEEYIEVPYHIKKIDVFGSITRDKEEPKDMDIIVVVEKKSVYCDLFFEVYKKFLGEGWEMKQKYPNVYDAVEIFLKEYYTKKFLDSNIDLELLLIKSMKIYIQWFPKITWNWFEVMRFNGPSASDFKKSDG